MKQAETDILRFARSIIDGSKPDITFNDMFFNLLRRTSLASAFYARYRDELTGEVKQTFRDILRGQQALEEDAKRTWSTLEEAPVPVYRMKEWTCRWPHRFSADVDVAVAHEDLHSFHQFLRQRGFLPLPDGPTMKKGSLHRAVKHKQLRLDQLYGIMRLQRKVFFERRVLHEGTRSLLDEADAKLTEKKDPWAHKFARLRKAVSFDQLGPIVDLLRRRFGDIYGERDAYEEYVMVLRDVQWLLDDTPGSSRRDRLGASGEFRDFEYHRGSEYIEVKRLDVTEVGVDQRLRTQGSSVEPVDNFILQASHFCKNIGLVGDERLFRGFLKYLIDGAYAFKNEDITVSSLLRRAETLNRLDETRFYLAVLGDLDFIGSVPCEAPWYYDLVPVESLLFNRRTTRVTVASWAVRSVWQYQGKTLNYKG
jgi:hypothetical protein